MSTQIARALQLHQEARLAEEQGNLNRAEVLYIESKEIFLLNGGMYLIDTALIMNAIACIKETYGDTQGALRAAEKAIQILENYGDISMSRKADEIRVQTWLILGRLRHQLAHYEKAEQVLLYALNYAANIFGNTDERTVAIREQLVMLKGLRMSS